MIVGMSLPAETDGHLDAGLCPEVMNRVGEQRQALHVPLMEEIRVSAPDEFRGQPGAHDGTRADEACPALGPGGKIRKHLFG